jgi:hypothetical protein
MYETTFTLKQHTPMLHFLSDQPGATLRATELKPKLDNWIRKELNDHLPPEWVSVEDDKGHKALEYKMKIKSSHFRNVSLHIPEPRDDSRTETGKKYETEQFPQVLANVGGKPYKDELKNLVFADEITITVSTWQEGLLTVIKSNLPKLLANQNFGNRPSKGFGSFTCIKIDDLSITVHPAIEYYFSWTTQNQYDFRNLFTAIDNFYKCIRSGINDVRPIERGNKEETKTIFYFKSLMYAYAIKDDPNVEWDKKIIKSHFYENKNISEEKRKDYRDWLGLSTDETWRKNRQLTRKFSMTKKSLTEGVDRFPSTVLIKPIRLDNNQFYIYFGEQLSEITATQFQNARIEVSMSNHRNTPLELRPAQHFNLTEFLNFIYEYRNENQLLEHLNIYDKYHINNIEHPLFRDTIAPIFRTMTQNPHAIRHA